MTRESAVVTMFSRVSAGRSSVAEISI